MYTRSSLKDLIAKSLNGLGISVDAEKIPLEHPADLKNGDYSSGIAMQYAKEAKVAPHALAEKVVATLGVIEGVAKVEVAGAGFINFYLAPSILAGAVDKARTEDRWGRSALNEGKKIMVEYTDPNPFKEFHIGHLMSNAIGESIARLLEFSGAEVKRANYQGDVGPHVAKAIFAKMRSPGIPWGVAYKMGNDLYDAFKTEIDDINKKIYERNREIFPLYEAGRNETLAEFELIYKKLGMEERKQSGDERFFDYYFYESITAPRGIALVRSHPQVFKESEGAIVYHGEDDGLHTRVFLTSKDLPTYETKELGLAELKAETWKFDTSITITAHEQSDYFEVVLAAMKKVLPEVAQKIRHISHGMMRFAEGKMSSRVGNVVTALGLLQELFDVAKDRAKESRADDHEKLAHDIALAAVKYQILKQASGKDIIFDRERALSLEGDSGPYLQYAHARAHAVVEKAREQNVAAKVDAETEPIELSRLLHRFPEAVEYAARELEPHLLTNYLLEFASAFNRWYANEQILDGSTGAPHKVALTDAACRTLKNGLWLLGIPAPEKM
ncbi:arginine--tRNA ligase [Candidatus Kaiserbacteria bacterium RIFCSPLOWO2_01_FULL_54_20]|uniref:Arginine--tRNA ligase n=1 Tax=Candidatus Kaiserbacteria bacterium RIFCSPLOWO2_01_FULL_54_20 TaxID=1798513 RepID=A0A1F6EJI8_9BACT|nr:MAG: arginine--tRNA ligase [Candidatus Kaiserbacteria bacterium RIFCSPLOWO2_01_FULL_54_20]